MSKEQIVSCTDAFIKSGLTQTEAELAAVSCADPFRSKRLRHRQP